jgi:hypothetical protein
MPQRSAAYYRRAANRFRKQRYIFVRGILSGVLLRYLHHYYEILLASDMFGKDKQCPLSLSLGGDPGFDAVLEYLRPEISRLAGLRLAPTYSYTRHYAKGDRLKRHQDRDACEISATVCIAIPKGAEPSTLYVKAPGEESRMIEMREGDGCIYAGTEVQHWRRPFRVGGYIQLFLHFIDRRGPHYPKLLYDGRKSLGVEYPGKKRVTKRRK